ncbi:CaaX farnesyltransferase beta subunit Ram1 [Taphrina deformans PYCC 5710]|uniref:Protein farnesyltransferase subunit beta n=1 Tax=Taphrina deformans (strain PYCC 5710 / ATCC 11124 / CBS 356.35 / IMI 108563 / JCM 9778 / NBRC 8474) TaxID=1097556 RepID=R4XBR9_TAPDE|nr:CaaX farnesyltransferase beta subunit Ram1 [Taphrina deformans PYCC 5710]|eukprot:CCG83310.1 CaaX farnesyltransferase beta subunit Ram1 [Taphrina deformans PYCC 5710]
MWETLQAQIDTERDCKPYLEAPVPPLNTKKHTAFLLRGLDPLSEGYISLDAARPWIFYWCLNGLSLMQGTTVDVQTLSQRLKESASACQHPDGGFGGGNGQMAHLAPTYAIILAIATLGDESVYSVVDRRKLYSWIMSLKQGDGGFAIQRSGEVDARAAYLALSVAALMDIMTPEMVTGTQDWLSKCQRYEGGISGLHNAEAHGGLAFCALAALSILGDPKETLTQAYDLPALAYWLSTRQMPVEGGFSGRTNKLVDGCYSWWVGAEYAMVECALGIETSLFDREALSKYILACSQIPRRGGLRDKPEKHPDYYHTCYCLAGLSAAQYHYTYDVSQQQDSSLGWHSFCWKCSDISLTSANEEDRVASIHPLYAIPWGKAEKLRAWSVMQEKI